MKLFISKSIIDLNIEMLETWGSSVDRSKEIFTLIRGRINIAILFNLKQKELVSKIKELEMENNILKEIIKI